MEHYKNKVPELPISETIIGTDLATIIDMLSNGELGWYRQVLLKKNELTPLLIFDEKCIESTNVNYPSNKFGTTLEKAENAITIFEYNKYLSKAIDNNIVYDYKIIEYPAPFFYGLKQYTIELFLK